MRQSVRLRRLLHVLGGGLGLAGVLFVAIRLQSYSEQLDLSRFGLLVWGSLAILAVLYGAANMFLARAWWCQLKIFGLAADWSSVLRVYGISQLAKYVPGNIFHLAGRHALGLAAGLPVRALVKSTVWELGSIAVAGVAFGLLIIPLVWAPVSQLVAVFSFFVAISMLFCTAYFWISKPAAVALLWQTLFLVVSGLVFVATLLLMADQVSFLSLVPSLCGAYVIAWLLGLVTPGAPAGVGIRESILLLLLEGQVVSQALIMAVVLGRVITVLGDLAFFAVVAGKYCKSEVKEPTA